MGSLDRDMDRIQWQKIFSFKIHRKLEIRSKNKTFSLNHFKISAKRYKTF